MRSRWTNNGLLLKSFVLFYYMSGQYNRSTSITVAFVTEYYPFIYKKFGIRDNLGGILVDVWKDFSASFEYKLRYVEYDVFGDEKSEGIWDGVFGEIQSGTVDGSVEKLKITSNRLRDFTHTAPVVYSSDTYISLEKRFDKFAPSSFFVFSPLEIFLFIAIVLLVAYIEQILYYIRQKIIHPNNPQSIRLFPPYYPYTFPFYPSHFIVLLILSTTYIRCIYGSAFTGSTATGGVEVTYLTDLIRQCANGLKQLVLEQDLYFNQEKESELFGKPVQLNSQEVTVTEGSLKLASQLCASDKFVGKSDTFGAAKLQLAAETIRVGKEPCTLAKVEPDVHHASSSSFLEASIRNQNPYAFFFNKKSPKKVVKAFNQIILRVYSFDMMKTFYWRRYCDRPLHRPKHDDIMLTYEQMKFKDVALILYFLGAGLLASIIICVMEFFWYHHKRRKNLTVDNTV